jgi:hypothetical protein
MQLHIKILVRRDRQEFYCLAEHWRVSSWCSLRWRIKWKVSVFSWSPTGASGSLSLRYLLRSRTKVLEPSSCIDVHMQTIQALLCWSSNHVRERVEHVEHCFRRLCRSDVRICDSARLPSGRLIRPWAQGQAIGFYNKRNQWYAVHQQLMSASLHRVDTGKRQALQLQQVWGGSLVSPQYI